MGDISGISLTSATYNLDLTKTIDSIATSTNSSSDDYAIDSAQASLTPTNSALGGSSGNQVNLLA